MNWLNNDEGDVGDASDPREKMDLPSELHESIVSFAIAARGFKQIYDSFFESGFDSAQSLALTIEFMKATLSA